MSDKYRLQDGNTILASRDFIAEHYPDAVQVFDEPAPQSPQPKPISILAFRSRFTDAEKLAIYTAAESHLPVRIWLDDLSAAQNQTIDLIDERIIAGVNAMEYGGLIGAGRATEILA